MVDEKNTKEDVIVEEKKADTNTQTKPDEKAPVTPPKPDPTPAPPKPTVSPKVAPATKAKTSRIQQEVEDYITKVKAQKTKEAIRRLWNIFDYITKSPEDSNYAEVLKLFKEHKDTILVPEVIFGAAGSMTLSQNTKLAIGYNLFKACAVPNSVKPGSFSAEVVKQEFGEKGFIWFNKTLPKKTFA